MQELLCSGSALNRCFLIGLKPALSSYSDIAHRNLAVSSAEPCLRNDIYSIAGNPFGGPYELIK